MHGVVTPNWLAAISGRSSPSSTAGASHHARHRGGGVGHDPGAEGVDAGDVDDGGREHHVALADDRPRVGGGDRRDDQLRHADRQGAHGLRGDRGAAGAAERQDAVAAALVEEPAGRPRSRPRPSRSPLPRDRRRRAARLTSWPAAAATCSRATSGSVCGGPSDAGVDQHRLHARRVQPVAQEPVLDALGVERADEHDGLGQRSLPSAAARCRRRPRRPRGESTAAPGEVAGRAAGRRAP